MASGISTRVLSSDPNELSERIKLLVREKQAGNNFEIIKEETVVIVDKILEYKSLVEKQPKSKFWLNAIHYMKKYNYSYKYSLPHNY